MHAWIDLLTPTNHSLSLYLVNGENQVRTCVQFNLIKWMWK